MVEDARLIREEVERCRGILSRMRVDIAEDGDKNQGAVSVAELVGRVAADLEPGRRGRLDVELGGSGEARVGAARAVQQAVAVMVRNAFDACGNEDHVRLTAGCVDGRVRLEISDRGCGMSAEVLRRAGEPFFTTKPPGSGMGLGLFLVRLVAERNGGRLAIQSVEGEGTTCVLEMPLA
jgi:two-component system sensor histidine kinase RegB